MIYALLFILSILCFYFFGKWQSRFSEPSAVSLNQVKKQLSRQLPAEQQHQLDRQLTTLLARGWSPQTLARVYLPSLTGSNLEAQFRQASQLGSPLFRRLWDVEKKYSPARRRLAIVLSLFELPEVWSTMQNHIAQQVGVIYPLSPADDFWRELADTVSQSFPNQQICLATDDLARQTHQLRYVLSLQQAQWVRANYGTKARTDRQALQDYLSQSGVSYSSRESARLHNKTKKGDRTFPSNLKILVNFHAEFILDEAGNFLNILDGTEEGRINGASFNYARRTNSRHWELDVWPVAKHDPLVRRRQLRRYQAPRRQPYFFKFYPSYHSSSQFDREVRELS